MERSSNAASTGPPTSSPGGRTAHVESPGGLIARRRRCGGTESLPTSKRLGPSRVPPSQRSSVACTYTTYMPNKTISVPDDVVPIIESLDVPFSRWVTDQLRRHATQSTVSFAQQLVTDAALAGAERRLTDEDARTTGERMERSAPW